MSSDKEKLIHNMARYIAKLDIDSDICIPTCNKNECLVDSQHQNGLDCDWNLCVECVKNWFSKDRKDDE